MLRDPQYSPPCRGGVAPSSSSVFAYCEKTANISPLHSRERGGGEGQRRGGGSVTSSPRHRGLASSATASRIAGGRPRVPVIFFLLAQVKLKPDAKRRFNSACSNGRNYRRSTRGQVPSLITHHSSLITHHPSLITGVRDCSAANRGPKIKIRHRSVVTGQRSLVTVSFWTGRVGRSGVSRLSGEIKISVLR